MIAANHTHRREMWALLAVLGTVVLWASAYPAIAIALTGFSPAPLAAVRFLFAALALLGIAAFSGFRVPAREDVPRIVLIGGIGIAVYNLLLNTGQTTVNAGTAGLLININPVLAALLARVFLKERLRPLGWLGIGIAFTGAALIATNRNGGGFSLSWGSLYILAAALCFAVQWVLQKPLLSRYPPLAVATWVIWSGTVLLLPFLPASVSALRQAPSQAVLAALYLGLAPAALAYAIWAYALANYSVTRATSFLYLVAPVTLLLAYLTLGEIPGPLTFVGGALALTGVVIVNRFGRASAKPAAISAAAAVPLEA